MPQSKSNQSRQDRTLGQWIVYIIHGFTLVAITLLLFRFVLQLFAANPDVRFVEFIYDSSDIVLAPFRGIFETRTFDNNIESVLDFSVLFAIAVYILLSYWMSQLIKKWEKANPPDEEVTETEVIYNTPTETRTTTKKKTTNRKR